MKSKIWPLQPWKWPLDLKDLRKGSLNFSKKTNFINQDKALRKMSYSSASWSNFENYQFFTVEHESDVPSIILFILFIDLGHSNSLFFIFAIL